MQFTRWEPIAEFNGFYKISDDGSVDSVERIITLPNQKKRLLKAKALKVRRNNYGYSEVRLSKDGKTYTRFIHRLVAEAFLPNPDNLPEVNHISGDKSDNTSANLEWTTHALNVQHSYDTGLNTNQKGNHTFAVGVIDNQLGKRFSNIKEWCSARGINYSTGRNILSGHNKSKKIDRTLIIKLNNKHYERINDF
ncbi:hypothetical protein CJD36_021370 [Flavipsychrobacter stenotrophus]|uniref:HNH nuclease domain-containing protein n=1 Tax=Flavipsychrobacter stenotrophus TaxID=2077091 RepID=A0A2S7SPZ7_9BACT|nr:NUMOD4 domain-containing protein [Flavipsychrobacter stenotrophus]PQJ08962.1 hypothetical protein CJD36_021370 [Flavipsychrobacter stenotrophus]